MKLLSRTLVRVALALVVVPLAGCNGAVVPASAPSAAAAALGAPAAGGGKLLYVADLGKSRVDYLAIPSGRKRGVLSGFGTVNGACVDAKGDVFISDGHDNQLDEYAHGGTKPIATLKDPGYFTGGCSVDPTTGDLAVAIQPVDSDPGGIAIFKHAKGTAQNHTGPIVYFPSFCGYDGQGNLFFDGHGTSGSFVFGELPAGGKNFMRISLNQQIIVAGGVQWDGKNVAVGDQGVGYKGSTIYRFQIEGTTGTEVGTTTLGGSSDVIQFWIAGNRVIGPNIGSSPNVMFWRYPSGGTALKTLTGFSEPVAVTVSP
jgi:hypothetical protein